MERQETRLGGVYLKAAGESHQQPAPRCWRGFAEYPLSHYTTKALQRHPAQHAVEGPRILHVYHLVKGTLEVLTRATLSCLAYIKVMSPLIFSFSNL